MEFSRAIVSLAASTILISGCASPKAQTAALRESLTLYASFDGKLVADFARGDVQLYGQAGRGRSQVTAPGLPANTNTIRVAKGAGRFGDALEFTRKSEALVFFKGPGNFDYRRTNWSGTVSFWLKLDPEKDLEPGYCDPLQVTAGNWNNGVFFAEFSKDHSPRHFRWALRPLETIWNPNKRGWEEVTPRPMIAIEKHPFSRSHWTHVVFTFENANTGRKDGVGTLYFDGKPAGEFRDWELTVNWNPEQMLVNIGASYVGLFDELSLFNRALTSAEVQTLHGLPQGLRSVLK
jgi:hypothetical protein